MSGRGASAPRTVVVTGASRGIGLATAEAFAAAGDRVILVGRSEEVLSSHVDRIQASGGTALHRAADLSIPSAVESLVEWIAAETGGSPDVCVFNAGASTWATVSETSYEQWQTTIDLNLSSVFQLAHLLVPKMVQRGTGRLVFVSSVMASRGVKNMSSYVASKAGVTALARTLDAETRAAGLKCTVICPGATATTMRDGHEGRVATPELSKPELQLSPGDVADAIVWTAGASATCVPTEIHLEPQGIGSLNWN